MITMLLYTMADKQQRDKNVTDNPPITDPVQQIDSEVKAKEKIGDKKTNNIGENNKQEKSKKSYRSKKKIDKVEKDDPHGVGNPENSSYVL